MKINYYHNKIKESLIACLTLVGHNDIINSFKLSTRLRIYSLFRQTIFKWTRHFNNENRFDHPVYTFPLLIIRFVVENVSLQKIFFEFEVSSMVRWPNLLAGNNAFATVHFQGSKTHNAHKASYQLGEAKHRMGET